MKTVRPRRERPGRPRRSPGRERGPGACAALLLALAPLAVLAAPPAASKTPAAAAGKGTSAAAPTDAVVVARVNGRPILRRDFDLAVQLQFRGRRGPVPLKNLQAIRDKILERLIENELLYQKAVRTQAPIPDKEVEVELEKMKNDFPSADGFASALRQNSVSEAEFKDQLRRTLLVTRFVDREIVGDLKVSDEEVRRYYEQNPEEMNRHEAVRLAQILVRVAADAPREARAAAREKIEAILKELRAGDDFADLARKYSEGAEASRGGDLGWKTRGAVPPAIGSVAFALQPDQTSDVVESRLGFHLLKVLEKRPAGPIPFEDVKERIRDKLVARDRREKIRAYVDPLKEQARVERHLKTTS